MKDTVLVIDDDMTVHGILKEILSEDYELIHAYNGKEGIKKYKKNQETIALILLDMEMPNRTGLEVLGELRALGLDDVPIVVLTSNTEHEMETKSIEAGAIDYIRKPINATVLKARIAAHISLKKDSDHFKFEVARILEDRLQMIDRIMDELKATLRSLYS